MSSSHPLQTPTTKRDLTPRGREVIASAFQGGRPPVPDRACLEGIIFVLKTGMPWPMLPTELGYGSGSTCWRRFRDWTRLGVWPELHRRLLRVLGRRGRLNLERAVIDSASVRALKGGRTPGRTPPTAASRAVSAIS
jgi:transposase